MKTQITSNISKVSARFQKMSKNLPGVVDKAVRELVTDDAIPQFEKTVRTWQHQPNFVPMRLTRGWGVRVEPEYPYGWVNRGTRKNYPIPKSPLPYPLRWRGPYHAKTKPNVISSYTGGRGNIWVSKRQVTHPGIKARNFQDIILRRTQTRAANAVRKALSDASYGAGVGL